MHSAMIMAALAGLMLAGCVTHETKPLPRVQPVQSATQIPTEQLLDVAVRLFDPNVPETEEEQAEQAVFAEVRRAEARYIPAKLRDTLEGTGFWGQVRVLPPDSDAMDVYVDGKILVSNGMELVLDVTVTDATGREWLSRKYESYADTRSYKDGLGKDRDPFQNVYSEIANDMLTVRQQLAAADLEEIRRVSDLRFAADLAPYAFRDYLNQDKNGQVQVIRLPAEGDPLLMRMESIRERDYALVDTLNEYYALFADNMKEPYTNWRRYSYDELEAQADARRAATTRKLLGAAAIIGGVLAGSESDTYVGRAASTAAIIGGVYAVKSGFDKDAEVKLHTESLRQLGESFQTEVQPMVVDVEGRTLQLSGSAEEQYAEWRRLLRELYETETGLAVPPPEAVSVETGSGSTGGATR